MTAGDNLRRKAACFRQTLCGFKSSPGSAASGCALKAFFEPVLWKDYLGQYLAEEANQYRTTARYVSVQTLADLDPVLKRSNTMVIRTGRGKFGLVQSSSINDFFLLDEKLNANRDAFHPTCDLLPFRLLGVNIEKNAVNLAIASGLLSEALELDSEAPRIAPAAGSSVYQFNIRPHRDLPDLNWPHNGQVEIDALLMAKRKEQWVLFVIEAKSGATGIGESLAKYKLVYSALAVSEHPEVKNFPGKIDIVPVYLRVWQDGDQLLFRTVECNFDGDRMFVSDLCPSRVRLLSMPLSV